MTEKKEWSLDDGAAEQKPKGDAEPLLTPKPIVDPPPAPPPAGRPSSPPPDWSRSIPIPPPRSDEERLARREQALEQERLAREWPRPVVHGNPKREPTMPRPLPPPPPPENKDGGDQVEREGHLIEEIQSLQAQPRSVPPQPPPPAPSSSGLLSNVWVWVLGGLVAFVLLALGLYLMKRSSP